ncbi:MAG: DUF6132 family protein [Prolixibacteraceae bacterium]
MENSCSTPSQPKSAREFFSSKTFLRPFIATLLGAVAGFLYYYFIGCSSGTCAISTNPYQSTLMGAFMGWFSVSSPCSRGKC